MSTDRETTRIVRSWLKTDEHESAERLLGTVLDRLDTAPQRRPMWRAWRERFMSGTFRLAAVGLATFAVAVIALGLYFSRPAIAPATSPTPVASPLATDPASSASPTPVPTTSATPHLGPDGLVAYPVCAAGGYPGPETCRIWVVHPDGTGAQELLPYEPLPDVPDFQNSPDHQHPLAWSPDGSQLLFSFSRVEFTGPQDGLGTVHSGLALTDAAGSEPEEFESVCPAELDVEPDQYNFCELRLDDQPVITFSPDGTRVAYVIHEDWGSGRREVEADALAILDLSTGAVTRLDTTQTTNRVVIESDLQPNQPPCPSAASQGYIFSPDWSPDGTRLAFVRSGFGPAENDLCQNGLFTVNVDSGEVSQVLLSRESLIQHPHWSSDGSRLLFQLGPGADDATKDVHTISPGRKRPAGRDQQWLVNVAQLDARRADRFPSRGGAGS